MPNPNNPTIPTLSPNVFLAPESIVRERIPVPIVERVDESARILRYVRGAPFPNKAFPFPEAVQRADMAKKLLRIMFKPWKPRKSLISFASTAYPYIRPYELKPEHMTECAEQVLHSATILCETLSLPPSLANIAAYIIQYDNAYRLIFEDLMSESKPELWKNPRKEVNRLLGIYSDRVHAIRYKKRAKLLKIVTVTLFTHNVREAITNAIFFGKVDFSKFQLDDIDRYWASMRGEYDFFGKKVEERYPKQVPEFVLI